MKKIVKKILIAAAVAAVCAAIVQVGAGLQNPVFSAAGAVPLMSAVMMAVMCWNYGSYPKKSAGMNAGGSRLNEEERTLMYHSLSSTLAYFIIPDLFLIMYFPPVVRMIAGAAVFIAGVYIATAYARNVTNKAFRERTKDENSANAENVVCETGKFGLVESDVPETHEDPETQEEPEEPESCESRDE